MRVRVIYKLAALVTHNAASALLQAAKCGGVEGCVGGNRNVLSLLVSSSFIAVAALCCVSQLTRLRTD